jgi:hypothetical protein
MKFCKDCKWIGGFWGNGCDNEKSGIDPINGDVRYNTAYRIRDDIKLCGPTAKWFDEKEKPIPECANCRFMSTPPYQLCSKNVTSPMHNRLNEARCGKYGKWWEKKEEEKLCGIPVNFDVGFAEKPGSFYVLPPLKPKKMKRCHECKNFRLDLNFVWDTRQLDGQSIRRYYCDALGYSVPISEIRECDTKCGMDGSWFEPKKQSWLCRLICGRKK